MIETMPCGCKAKPINNVYKLRNHLIDGNVILYDDPHCVEHEEGTGIVGFMIYSNGIVHSQYFEYQDDNGINAQKTIDDALVTLTKLHSAGFDFSYGKAKLEVNGGQITILCCGL